MIFKKISDENKTRVSIKKKIRTRYMLSIKVVMTESSTHKVTEAWFYAKLIKLSAMISTDSSNTFNVSNSC